MPPTAVGVTLRSALLSLKRNASVEDGVEHPSAASMARRQLQNKGSIIERGSHNSLVGLFVVHLQDNSKKSNEWSGTVFVPEN